MNNLKPYAHLIYVKTVIVVMCYVVLPSNFIHHVTEYLSNGKHNQYFKRDFEQIKMLQIE